MENFKQWRSNFDFSNSELDLLNTPREDVGRNINFSYWQNKFLYTLIASKFIISDECQLKISECATNLINELFETYTDNDTLIITTEYEHPNVNKILDTKNNVFYVDMFDLGKTYEELRKELEKFNKVFIYISGTQISTGRVIPDLTFKNLKSIFRSDHKVVFVLDDVQGMFMVPRDYTLFTYIIGTAHSLVPYYDMGICLCNCQDYQIGYTNSDWVKGYLDRLDIVLSRRSLLNQFYDVCQHHFKNLFESYGITYFSNKCDHIFAFNLGNISFSDEMGKVLFDKRIFLHHPIAIKSMPNSSSIKIRAQEFMRFNESIDKGIGYLEMLIKEKGGPYV